MRMIPIVVTPILTILFFSGCSPKQHEVRVDTHVTLKQRCPRLKVLKKPDINVPEVNINAVGLDKNGNVIIPVDDIVKASNVSQRLRLINGQLSKQIDFYIKQIVNYNEIYARRRR